MRARREAEASLSGSEASSCGSGPDRPASSAGFGDSENFGGAGVLHGGSERLANVYFRRGGREGVGEVCVWGVVGAVMW